MLMLQKKKKAKKKKSILCCKEPKCHKKLIKLLYNNNKVAKIQLNRKQSRPNKQHTTVEQKVSE